MEMFINNKHTATRTLSLIASLAIAFTSCVQLGEEQDAAYGYLTIGGFDVDVQVGQLVPTKADGTVNISGVTGYSAPSLSSVTVTSVEDNSKTYEWSGTVLKLPVGNYTLAATSGSNAFDAPYFTGEGTVEVISGQEVTGKVTFTLANSVMKVTNGMTDHVDSNKPVTISAGDDESLETQYGTYVFVPSGRTLSISGYNTAGGQFHKEVGSLDPQKAYEVKLSTNESLLPSITLPEQQDGAWGGRLYVNPVTSVDGISSENLSKIVYKVYSDEKCTSLVGSSSQEVLVIDGLVNNPKYYVRAEVGNLLSDIKEITVVSPTVTTSHYNDDSGNLAGTTATLDLKLNDFLTAKIVVGDITLVKDGITMRTVTASGQTTMTEVNNYPYLPQGIDYVLNVNHKLKTESEYKSSSMTDIEVGAPEFFTPTVSLGNTSYTSYDKYAGTNVIAKCINGDTNVGTTMGANNCQPETLYFPSAVIGGISENLIKNSNYVKKISFLVDGDLKSSYENGAMTSNSQTGADVTSLSWGSHTLTATFEFDGKSATSEPKTHHITGLPYSYNFVNGSLDKYRADGWTTNGDLRVSNMSLLGRPTTLVLQQQDSEGFIVSPRFNITSDISVQASILRSSYFLYWGGSRSRTGYVGAVSNTSTSNIKSRTYSCEGGSSTGGAVYGSDEWLDAFVISMSSPYISIDSDSRVEPSTASYYFLHAAHFRYAE